MEKTRKSIVINYTNLVLGVFLLFLLLTNVELNSTVANFLFPLVVLVFGKISYRKITEPQKRKILFYLPSFVGSICFYAVTILICVFCFVGSVFWVSEEMNKTRIQHCYSPNKIEYCDVYHYPVGAYAGGSGRLRIFLVNKYFPIIRKEVYYESKSYLEITKDTESEYYTSEYDIVEWEDNNNIKVGSVINIREISFYPYEIVKYLITKRKEKGDGIQ